MVSKMKKFVTSLLFFSLFAMTSSATSIWFEDEFFTEHKKLIYVSKCHYVYKLISTKNSDQEFLGNRFYLLIMDDAGYLIRESDKGFDGIGSLNRLQEKWRLDIASMTTAEMAGELSEKLNKADFILVYPEEFSLNNLSERTENCGSQDNPWIDFHEGRYDPMARPPNE